MHANNRGGNPLLWLKLKSKIKFINGIRESQQNRGIASIIEAAFY